jgi:hypothetical protein
MKRIRSDSVISLMDSSLVEPNTNHDKGKGKACKIEQSDDLPSDDSSASLSLQDSGTTDESDDDTNHVPSKCLCHPPHSQATVKQESTGCLLSHSNFKDSAIDIDEARIWPSDFYCCDINEGFKQCAIAAKSHCSVAKIFTAFFGVDWASSTFYDNQCIWNATENHALHQQFVQYGHHHKGTWSAFMAKAERPKHS